MLLLRPNPLPDESLESYLIRLAELYSYTPNQLIGRFHIILNEKDQKLTGALPTDISRINLFHANISSALRFQCLELLAEKVCKGRFPILQLAVYRSRTKYAGSDKSLLWNGLDIPRRFFRKHIIPVCPACLAEAEVAYIPQYWHLNIVRACPIHGCKLLEFCRSCNLRCIAPEQSTQEVINHFYGMDSISPRRFFRKHIIPVCPACLAEAEVAYIPQYWHLNIVRACPIHGCKLLEFCPECSEVLNYMLTGNLESCACGAAYKTMPIEMAEEPLLSLAKVVSSHERDRCTSENLLFTLEDIHQIFGAIVWFFLYVADEREITDDSLLKCIKFFNRWPSQLDKLLENKFDSALECSDRLMSATPFYSIFENLLIVSRNLPSTAISYNPILKGIFNFLDRSIQANNRSSELGYLLLNGFEAGALLDTTQEQIARLLEEGHLHTNIRLKSQSSFESSTPLFNLKDVFYLWISGFQSRLSNRHLYLSEW